MMYPDINLMAWLLAAHFLGDFTFQPQLWVDEKRRRKWRSPFLYYHVLVHFLLAGAVIVWVSAGFIWIGVLAALVIALGHFVFDLSKIYYIKFIENEMDAVGLQRGLVFLWDSSQLWDS